MRHQPIATPQKYMSKCLGLQKLYSDLKTDLQQEMTMITNKLVNPAEEARQQLKGLKKTIKHRENTKLDYERYLGRAEHARRKETRSAKEEAALAKHENDLAQAQIDYQSADDQIKETFPPIAAAVKTLLPVLMANQIRIHTVLVGQVYTVLDAYTRQQGLPNPAPSDDQIVAKFEQEFTSFRMELEGGIQTIASGKAVNMPMAIPEKDRGTYTGLGLRNRVMNRGKSDTSVSRPNVGSRQASNTVQPVHDEEEELAPPKPPRPGASPSPSFSPGIPTSSKPHIPSMSSASQPPPYAEKPHVAMPSPAIPNPWANERSSGQVSGGATPPSRYATPLAGSTPTPFSGAGPDYFTGGNRRPSAASSVSAASIAGKKKPPPPVPAKRIPSAQVQYVTALYDFEGQNEGDLAFREGDRIKVIRKTESVDDWWDGEVEGRKGVFPANYVRV